MDPVNLSTINFSYKNVLTLYMWPFLEPKWMVVSNITYLCSFQIILNCIIFRFNKEISRNYNSKSTLLFIFWNSNSKWNFLFCNFELVTRSETFYSSTQDLFPEIKLEVATSKAFRRIQCILMVSFTMYANNFYQISATMKKLW